MEGGSGHLPDHGCAGHLNSFDTHCDLACVYQAVLDEARCLSSWTSEKEAALLKAFFQKIPSCD